MSDALNHSSTAHTASFIPSALILFVSAWTALLFQSQGEADVHAPAFFGLGLAMCWRLRRPRFLNQMTRWIYLSVFSVFIIERSLPHPVWIQRQWVDVASSKSLVLCGVSLYLIGVLTWFIDRRQRSVSPPERGSSSS